MVRDINLKAILKSVGACKDKLDNNKWHTSQGIISVKNQKFMNWTRMEGGGGAIDLIIHLHKFDFRTAVIWLFHRFQSINFPSAAHLSNPPNPSLKLPLRDESKLTNIVEYLRFKRHLPHSLIKTLIDSGKIYADNRSNAVFLLLGKENKSVGAELHGTKSRWKGMALGSKKKLGYFHITCSNPKRIVICESAIDAISYFSLYPHCMVVSTSGANSNPYWLSSLINKGCIVYCGFDSDHTGENLAQTMIKLYPTIRRLRPPLHDWNEVLVNSINRKYPR